MLRTMPICNSESETTTQKKLKTKESDPEERKKRSDAYRSFINRGGPDAPGSKDIPDGQVNCLKNLTFVISGRFYRIKHRQKICHCICFLNLILMHILGVLESLERDECKSLIEKYGGRVTLTISGKTNYLLTGRDASEGKINKAKQSKIEILREDDLLHLIRTRSGDASVSKKHSLTTTTTTTTTTTAQPIIMKSKGKSISIGSKTSETNIRLMAKPTMDPSDLLCK
jgi:replication factor C subunit 1